jgi:hypothetical protein
MTAKFSANSNVSVVDRAISHLLEIDNDAEY